MLDFLLALAPNGDEKAFKFVSGNLSGFLLCHMQRLNQKQRIDPFIKIYQHEILTRLDEHVARIRHIRNEEGNRVAFTAGIDDKVIVNSYQVSFYHGVVVGGAYPNNYLFIDEVKGEGLKLF